jgi:hypothetical protein
MIFRRRKLSVKKRHDLNENTFDKPSQSLNRGKCQREFLGGAMAWTEMDEDGFIVQGRVRYLNRLSNQSLEIINQH